MDDQPPKSKLEELMRRIVSAIRKVHAFLQTPFGATAGGGLFVVLAMKLFG